MHCAGILEPGEQCDCGYDEWECNDPCCYPGIYIQQCDCGYDEWECNDLCCYPGIYYIGIYNSVIVDMTRGSVTIPAAIQVYI